MNQPTTLDKIGELIVEFRKGSKTNSEVILGLEELLGFTPPAAISSKERFYPSATPGPVMTHEGLTYTSVIPTIIDRNSGEPLMLGHIGEHQRDYILGLLNGLEAANEALRIASTKP